MGDGKPLRLDGDADSADAELPAFLARPEGAPVYHGFPILDDVQVDGFRLGMISDWEAEAATEGDAFVVAPDDSRAGLVWEVSPENRFQEVLGFEPGRWGVWGVTFPHAMDSRDGARRNLAHILPELRRKWEEWRARQG
jgi:hypothetical protein